MGEDTWRLTRSPIGYEALGEVRVKGKTEPVDAFRVVDDQVAGRDATPFVGRTAEIEALGSIIDTLDDAAPLRGFVTVMSLNRLRYETWVVSSVTASDDGVRHVTAVRKSSTTIRTWRPDSPPGRK